MLATFVQKQNTLAMQKKVAVRNINMFYANAVLLMWKQSTVKWDIILTDRIAFCVFVMSNLTFIKSLGNPFWFIISHNYFHITVPIRSHLNYIIDIIQEVLNTFNIALQSWSVSEFLFFTNSTANCALKVFNSLFWSMYYNFSIF